MNYCTTEQLKQYAQRTGRGDDELHESVIPRASRIIDRLCELPDGHFAQASERCSVFTVRGSGTRLLRLPPYVRGSIDYVEYAGLNQLTPNYAEVADASGVQWLEATSGCWTECPIEITARWGWHCTPDEIVEAAIELAMMIWRQKDAAFLRVQADFNGAGGVSGAAIPERVKAICDKWKRKREVVIC